MSSIVTVFLGAFLLFQVQPLIGKYILPWFGGGPGVWTTCMLFFQILLLGGYAYAHILTKYFRPRAQSIIHLILLVASLALLPIVPSDSWKPRGTENPTLYILFLLTVCLGLPYFVLSSTGPLIQHWFLRANPTRSPYRLYALSNTGSLLALITYPFYFESHFTRRTQATMWAFGLAAYALSCALCIRKLWSVPASEHPSKASASHASALPPSDGPILSSNLQPSTFNLQPSANTPALDHQPSTINYPLTFSLPACASILLLAVTNKICQDVAVIPFLWILPLALYLLSFIICFDSPRWYLRWPFMILLLGAFGGFYWAFQNGSDSTIYKQLAIYCIGLFVCAMVCHGELYRLRPEPERLTAFYLLIAAGGASGGIFVACLAPLLFTNFYELHCGILLCSILILLVWSRELWHLTRARFFSAKATRTENPFNPSHGSPALSDKSTIQNHGILTADHGLLTSDSNLRSASSHLTDLAHLTLLSRFTHHASRITHHAPTLFTTLFAVSSIALAAVFYSEIRDKDPDKIYTSRNFYGVLTVFEHRRNDPNEHHFLLQHGRITHGLQFADPDEAVWATTYYGEDSGIGLAARALPPSNRRIGLVGLGTGTFVSYGKAGDCVHVYEINPAVRQIAYTNFSYLSHSPAKIEIALGDARLSMEREDPQHFDLLVLDAFSSDAIPVHLLTREAFQIYQRHLNTNAIIAVHISNHYLDLEPVVANLARAFDYKLATIDFDETDEEWWLYASTWILLTRNSEILNSPVIKSATLTTKSSSRTAPLWTDDFTSLFQILK